MASSLPPLPHLTFDVELGNQTPAAPFLSVQSCNLNFTSGPANGRSFRYDVLRRRAVDAAVIVAYARDDHGRAHIFLRSAIRPPLALRDDGVALDSGLWELPAGLVEPGEEPAEAAARELEEEVGFAVSPASLVALGPPVVPAPAIIGERQFGFAVDVTGLPQREPSLDGSLLELGGCIVCIDAKLLVEYLYRESVVDAKTELFLLRFLRSLP